MGKKNETTEGTAFETASPSPARTMLGPLDIQQKEFRVARFGGYKMRDVDEFLDTVTDSMSALVAEVDRLRKGAPSPVVGAPDLADVSRQADEIIERARTEAARIVAEAKVAGVGRHVGARGQGGGERIPRQGTGVPPEPRRPGPRSCRDRQGDVEGNAEAGGGCGDSRARGRSGGGRAHQGRAHRRPSR